MSRSALVTGGTGGIGSAIVRRLRADGYEVVFCGRDEQRAAALERHTGAVFCEADATDRAACDASVAFALERLGRVDLFVANAGILSEGPLAGTTDEEFELLVETNLTSTFRYGRALFAPMRRQGSGVMILIASDSAIRGSHRIPAYSVVKAGVVALAELFGAEGAPYGIRANAVCPGNTLPGMAGDDPANWRTTASGAFATADEVAAAVAFLASRDAAHINGATLRIDGGTGAALQMVTRSAEASAARSGDCLRSGRLLARARGLAHGVARDRLGIGGAQRLGDLFERVVVAQAVVELLLERRDPVLGLARVLAGRAGDLRKLRRAEDQQDDHGEHEQMHRILEAHGRSLPRRPVFHYAHSRCARESIARSSCWWSRWDARWGRSRRPWPWSISTGSRPISAICSPTATSTGSRSGRTRRRTSPPRSASCNCGLAPAA